VIELQAFSCDKYARHRLLGEAELRLADVDLHSEEIVRIWLNLHEIDEVCGTYIAQDNTNLSVFHLL